MGSPDWHVAMINIHLRKLPWVYCLGHAGVKGNGSADRLSWKINATITSGSSLRRPEAWGTWDTTCRHKAKDITPSIAWRRKAFKEQALDDLPGKDERGPLSVRRTLEPFQRQRWGNFWETRWSEYGLFRAHRYHFELNWTELNSVSCKQKVIHSKELEWLKQGVRQPERVSMAETDNTFTRKS